LKKNVVKENISYRGWNTLCESF